MRARRAGLAALLAAALYVLSIAAAPLIQLGTLGASNPVRVGAIGVAYADDASTACAKQSGASAQAACAACYRDAQKGEQSGIEATAINNKDPKDCQAGFNFEANSTAISGAGTSTSSDGTVNQDQCAANDGGLGWLSCPIFDRVTNFITTDVQGLLSQFLAVQPLNFSGPIYDTWSSIRTLANILFVLVFMVLIFAHVANFNIDAYALKVMIPKLAAGAILVQFSFVIASVIVDIGNISGAGIGALIGGITHASTASTSGTDIVGGIIENLISVLALTSAIAIANLILAGPVIMIVVIGILGAIVVLALRYFLIGLLIVAAPLAFVAWILPNTDSIFRRWLSTFFKLVLMYPIIMALLAVAGDIGGLLPVAAPSASTAGQVGQTLGLTVIKVLIVAGSLMAIPQTFKWAGGAMEAGAGQIGNLTRAGMSAKWNSVGTSARRNIAREERLHKAQRLQERLETRNAEADGVFGKALNSGRAMALRGKMVGPAALMLAGTTGDRHTRQYNYSSLVDDYAKSIGHMDEAKDSQNLENALMHHFVGRQIGLARDPVRREQLQNQQKQLKEKLDGAGAGFLLDYTGTTARREAMMNQLAQKSQLKQPMLKAIQDIEFSDQASPREHHLAKEDKMAFIRQGYDKGGADQPFLFQIDSDSNLRKPQVPIILESMSASKIKSNFHGRNFAMMSSVGTAREVKQAHDAADLFARHVNSDELRLNFQYKSRETMAPDQQMHMLLAMARNQDIFTRGAGQQMKNRVVNQILYDQKKDDTAHSSMLQKVRQAAVEDAQALAASQGRAFTEADERAATDEVLRQLNSIARTGDTEGRSLEWPPEVVGAPSGDSMEQS